MYICLIIFAYSIYNNCKYVYNNYCTYIITYHYFYTTTLVSLLIIYIYIYIYIYIFIYNNIPQVENQGCNKVVNKLGHKVVPWLFKGCNNLVPRWSLECPKVATRLLQGCIFHMGKLSASF